VKSKKDDGTEQKISSYQGTVKVDEEKMRLISFDERIRRYSILRS